MSCKTFDHLQIVDARHFFKEVPLFLGYKCYSAFLPGLANYIYDMISYRFSKFMSCCLDMDHPLVSFILSDSMHLAYSFIGYNFLFGSTHLKFFNDNDLCIANTIRFYRHMYGSFSPNEDCISTLSS